ncbi:MAG: NnrS family protein [Oleispira sp.]
MNKVLSSPLWSLAFRPFFILGSLSSVISLVIWLVYLNSGEVLSQNQMLSPVLWHIHEMFFGFTLMIAIGFLLTAVQTWTGLKSLQGHSLISLSLIWIAIRILLLQNQNVFPGLLEAVIVLQVIWWGIVFVAFSRLIIKAGSRKNYIFLPLLVILMILQLSFLYYSQAENDLLIHLARSAILFFSIIVGLISGRVIPLFTRNALADNLKVSIKTTPKLDNSILIFSVLGSLNFLLSGLLAMPFSPAWLLLLVGALHLLRLSQWGNFYTLNNPLLWSLHSAYLCLSAGLMLVALSFFTESIRIADAFHLITVGAFGGMILAMISRVSLGHTGRPLQVNNWMVLAFLFIFIAVVLRVVLAVLNQPLWAWNSSALLWIAAYSIFLKFYIPVLTRARR